MAKEIPYLDVQNLTKRFGAQVIFDGISFSIAEGQKVGLIAKNGTGKSTLLSVLPFTAAGTETAATANTATRTSKMV
jgi:ATPase subunit of ABC transporter with duplicated ATPase domains